MVWTFWIPLVLAVLAGADEDCFNEGQCDVGVSALQKKTEQRKLHAATGDASGASSANFLHAKMRIEKKAKLMKKHLHFKNFMVKKEEPASFGLENFCAEVEDFRPDNSFMEMCVFHATPSEEKCNKVGCFAERVFPDLPEIACHCMGRTSCREAGGVWTLQTCGSLEHPQKDRIAQVFEEVAAKGGSCEGIMVGDEYSLADEVRFPAEKCCSSYPKTVCEKDAVPAELVTPCANDEAFDALATAWGHCDVVFPGHEKCYQAGCFAFADETGYQRCYCEDSVSCGRLSGEFVTQSCVDEVREMYSFHDEMREISASGGTCSEGLEYDLEHVAEKCCVDFPKTLCAPDREMPTPCVAPDSFLPSQSLKSFCIINQFSAAPKCQHLAHGGWHQVDGKWIFEEPPQNAAACEDCRGTWWSETCRDRMRDILEWDEGFLNVLNDALNGHGCGEYQSQIEDLNEKCCSARSPQVCQELDELQLMEANGRKAAKKAAPKKAAPKKAAPKKAPKKISAKKSR